MLQLREEKLKLEKHDLKENKLESVEKEIDIINEDVSEYSKRQVQLMEKVIFWLYLVLSFILKNYIFKLI